MLILNKDDLEFPCLLGHPALKSDFKETVSEIPRDPSCKDDNAWFTTVPFKPLSD